MNKEIIIEKMKEIFKDVPYGIDHTMKVFHNAELIINGENLHYKIREIILITAILHDIGAIEAQKKHGSMDGHYQELEGPPIARIILQENGFNQKFIERVCYIIGNHHSPEKIDGIDFQIQWEADLLENLTANEIIKDKFKLMNFIDDNFKTQKGNQLAFERFYYNNQSKYNIQ